MLVALALAYAYPVRVYLAQQADIARIERPAAQRAEIAELADEGAKWDDEYVKTKAGKVLHGAAGRELMVVLPDAEGAARDAGKSAGRRPGRAGALVRHALVERQAADSQQPGK